MIVYFVFGLSIILSFLITIPTIKLAKRFGLVTDKKKRIHPAHTHFGIIPRAGGVPIYITILILSLFFLELNKIIISILIASFLLVILGLLDDYYDLSPYYRFIANLFISGIVIAGGLGIPYITNPFGGVIHLNQWIIKFSLFKTYNILIVSNILAIIWLTWTTNMVNWSKGVDGQLPGFVAITAFFLGLLAQRFTAHDITIQSTTILSFIIAGAYLGFLPHNFYPQKIMPGYSGGALAGFLLGILSILSFGKVGTAILVLSIPTIDALYTILRRLKTKKSPFKADWGHFHHRLLEIGWGRKRIAVFYWLISFILGISSLFFVGTKKLTAFLTVLIILPLFMIIIERLKKKDFGKIKKHY